MMRLRSALRAAMRQITPEAIPVVAAPVYDALPGRFMRPAQERISERVRATGGVIVDIGCGPGMLAAALARRSAAVLVVGVDLSAPMLALAARRARHERRVAWVQANAARLPFADESIDVVVSVGSLHHWRDPVAGINQIHRCLRPGGWAWIFDGYRDAADADMIRALPGLRSAVARWVARKVMSVHGFSRDEYQNQVRGWFARSRFGGCEMTPDLLWMRMEARRQ
jgi:ubiquinone/menaquinone biosynthesis C-methylase UbiE